VTVFDYLKNYRGKIIRLLSKELWKEIKQKAFSQGEFDAIITWSFGNLLGVFISAQKYIFIVPVWPGTKIKYKWWERILATYHHLDQRLQDFLIELGKLQGKKILIFLPPRRGDTWEDGKMLYGASVIKEMQNFAEVIELPVKGHRKAVTDTLNIQKILSAL